MKRTLCAVAALSIFILPAPVGRAQDGGTACGRIAYLGVDATGHSSGIYSIRPDGTGRKELPESGVPFAWSPDGRTLAFVSDSAPEDRSEDHHEIYVVQHDGSDYHQLTHDGIGRINTLSWSPDSQQIAYERHSFSEDRDWISVVSMDGESRVIVEDAVDPAWSPVGDRIAYSTYIDPFQDVGDIYLVNPDGTNPERLTPDEDAMEAEPSWSPDASDIAFLRYPAGQDGENGPFADLFRIDVATKEQQQLTRIQSEGQGVDAPRWSPNNRWIAYTVEASDYNAVAYKRAAGGKEYRLGGVGGFTWHPDWAGSGNRFVYEASTRSGGTLKIRSVVRHKSRVMTGEGASPDFPDWAAC